MLHTLWDSSAVQGCGRVGLGLARLTYQGEHYGAQHKRLCGSSDLRHDARHHWAEDKHSYRQEAKDDANLAHREAMRSVKVSEVPVTGGLEPTQPKLNSLRLGCSSCR